MLKINNITKTFHDKKIIDNVSLSADEGEIIIFLGQSGVGKSTLLRCLNNLEKIDSGSFSLDGQELNVGEIHKNMVGMVFQQFNLFDHLTVMENITLALIQVQGKSRAEAEKIAQRLLDIYGLGDKGNSSISEISGGQKQRLALARTIALQPNILCMDEPTSALDPQLTSYVAKHLQELASQGYIILIATHDTALLDMLHCTIHLMKAGKIVETASSEKLKRDKTQFPQIAAFVAGAIE